MLFSSFDRRRSRIKRSTRINQIFPKITLSQFGNESRSNCIENKTYDYVKWYYEFKTRITRFFGLHFNGSVPFCQNPSSNSQITLFIHVTFCISVGHRISSLCII